MFGSAVELAPSGRMTDRLSRLVGAARFELAASRSQTVRTTRLCYAPLFSTNETNSKSRILSLNIPKVKSYSHYNRVIMGLFVQMNVLDDLFSV